LRATKYQKSKKPKAQGEFRKHSVNQDRKNARSNDGKSQKKKMATSKPTDNERTCKAKLLVRMDSFSFFLVCGKGSSCHEGHPPKTIEEMPSCKRLLLEEAKDEAKLLANHGACPGLIAIGSDEEETRHRDDAMTSIIMDADNVEACKHNALC
jgi:hypothetical protein